MSTDTNTGTNTDLDVIRIEQAILHERQGRDRGWWDQTGAAFADDSQVSLSWYSGDGAGFVAGSQRMSEQGGKAAHRLSPSVVHVRGGRGRSGSLRGADQFQPPLRVQPHQGL